MKTIELLFRVLTVGVAACVWSAHTGAAQIGIGDFSGSETITTFDGLNLSVFNATPLVLDGNIYTTDSGIFRYRDTFPDCTNECIGNDTDTGFIDVVLGSTRTRVGARVGFGEVWSGLVEFFDAADALLGSITFTDEGTMQFAGWEDFGGISRLRVTDTATNMRIIVMDDFRFETIVPIPAALPLFAASVAVIGFVARRRRLLPV